MKQKQKILILYLSSSSLDSKVIAWTEYDGTKKNTHMAGDSDIPPYTSGLEALQDGWRLFQVSSLDQHIKGNEYKTGYLKYEFMFEKIEVN
jgi:hypothetical protein